MRYILAFCLALLAQPAPAEILFSWRDAGPSMQWPNAVITVSGEINKGDNAIFDALADLAATTKITVNGAPFIRVELDSPGGDVFAAMLVGKTIRDRSMWTFVGSASECASACSFILQAGVNRTVAEGGRIGLHRPKFPTLTFADLSAADARAKYNAAIEAIHAYWDFVGGSDRAWQIMMATPSNSMTYIEVASQIAFYGLAGHDPAYEELRIAKLATPLRPYKPTPVDYDPFLPK